MHAVKPPLTALFPDRWGMNAGKLQMHGIVFGPFTTSSETIACKIQTELGLVVSCLSQLTDRISFFFCFDGVQQYSSASLPA